MRLVGAVGGVWITGKSFEISTYGTLRTWAVVIGNNQAMQALEVTLEEEKNADALLTNIAATLNLRAAHAE